MSEKQFRRVPLAIAAVVTCMSAQAEYQSPDGNFRMSGFGTLGAARSTTDDAIFNYPGQNGGATKHGSLDPDSKIAVQGTYKFTPTVSATTQVMTKYDAEGQYVPKIDWAFAKWQAAPALAVRAGRMGAPFFMISDFRDVGYANIPARPPLDVYGQVPVSQFEGLDASYQLNLGAATVTSTLWTGDSEAPYGAGNRPQSDVIVKRIVGLNIVTELSNGLSLRFGHAQGKMSIKSSSIDQLTAATSSATLLGGLAAYGASPAPDAAQATAAISQLGQAGELFGREGADVSFSGVGLAYDQDDWVASLEFTKRRSKTFISNTTGWYGLVGYRVNAFTPYVGLSKLKADRVSDNPVSTVTLVGSPTLRGIVNTISSQVGTTVNGQRLDQRTSTVGVRWDAQSNLAFKAQYDRISKPAGSNGLFLVDTASAPGAAFQATKKTIGVLTLSVDFVF